MGHYSSDIRAPNLRRHEQKTSELSNKKALIPSWTADHGATKHRKARIVQNSDASKKKNNELVPK